MANNSNFVELHIALHPASVPWAAKEGSRTYRIDMSLRSPKSDAKRTPSSSALLLFTIDEQSIRASSNSPLQYGRYLCDKLFANPEVKTFFAEARSAAANEQGIPLRIRLEMGHDAQNLHTLRWETLRDPGAKSDAFLFANENVLFSRFLGSEDRRLVTIGTYEKLRALVVIANPKVGEHENLHPIDVDGEKKRALEGLGDIPTTVLCKGSPDGSPTLANLITCLHDNPHILFLICHGKMINGVSNIYLEDEQGNTDAISAEEMPISGNQRRPGLVAELRQLNRTPRLILLYACQSAGDGKPWTSYDEASPDEQSRSALGPRLVEDAGVPFVVAMQGSVTMQTVKEFMPVFFREFRRDGQIDRAMAVARAAVIRSGRKDWWMPALFTRLENGRLFGSPADQLLGFIREQIYILALIGLLIFLQAVFFFFLRDRYLVALYGQFWVVLTILSVPLGWAVWGWSRLRSGWPRSIKRMPLLSASAAFCSLAWLGLVISLGWQVLRPESFTSEEFGIAIATFREDSDWWTSRKAYEGANLVHGALKEKIDSDKSGTLAKTVRLRRIGLIPAEEWDTSKARDQIGASLVILGALIELGNSVKIDFHVLQAPDFIDNPSLAQAIPLQDQPLQTSVTIPMKDFETESGTNRAGRTSLGIASFSLGLAYYYRQEYRQASIQFRTAVANLDNPINCPTSQDASSNEPQEELGVLYYFLGKSYQYIGRFDKSYEALDQALCYDPEDMASLLGQSYNYRVLGMDAERQDALNKVIELSIWNDDSRTAQVLYNRAFAYVALEDDENALFTYTKIYKEINPSFFIAYLGAAEVLTRLKRYAEAEQVYQAAAALAEDDITRQAGLEVGKGKLYEAWANPEQAQAAYLKAIELNPNFVTPRFLLAELYARSNQNEPAAEQYLQVIELSDVPAWSHTVYAKFLAQMGNYAGAIDHFREALLSPAHNYGDIHANLGLAYAEVDESLVPDKEKKALEQFMKAVEDPGDNKAWILHEYGRVLYRFGDVEGAIKQFEDSLEANEGFGAETRWNLGQLYEHTGKPEKAIEMYVSLVEGCEDMSEELGINLMVKRLQAIQLRLKALGVESPACNLMPQG